MENGEWREWIKERSWHEGVDDVILEKERESESESIRLAIWREAASTLTVCLLV